MEKLPLESEIAQEPASRILENTDHVAMSHAEVIYQSFKGKISWEEAVDRADSVLAD